jgi:hypothetical protein
VRARESHCLHSLWRLKPEEEKTVAVDASIAYLPPGADQSLQSIIAIHSTTQQVSYGVVAAPGPNRGDLLPKVVREAFRRGTARGTASLIIRAQQGSAEQ